MNSYEITLLVKDKTAQKRQEKAIIYEDSVTAPSGMILQAMHKLLIGLDDDFDDLSKAYELRDRVNRKPLIKSATDPLEGSTPK